MKSFVSTQNFYPRNPNMAIIITLTCFLPSYLPLVVDCGPVDVVLGEVVFESSGNSTVFGSRIQYSCRDSVKVNSEYFTVTH